MRLFGMHFYNLNQRILALCAVFYLLFLISTIVFNSFQRSSVLSGGLDSNTWTGGAEVAAGKPARGGTKLRLKDFHRVEVKDGRESWEISAKEARYFAKNSVVLVTDAALTVFQDDGSQVLIASKGAKLHLDSSSVGRVELEGNIKVEVSDSFLANADYAVYHSDRREITSANEVTLSGDGYVVQGIGFQMKLATGEVHLLDSVESSFSSEAELPKSFGSLGNNI